jgi:hypothetical protein
MHHNQLIFKVINHDHPNTIAFLSGLSNISIPTNSSLIPVLNPTLFFASACSPFPC